MNFNFSTLLASFIFGTFGFFLLKRGRSEAHIPHLILGLGLMIYPYFFDNEFLVWGLGVLGLYVAYRLR